MKNKEKYFDFIVKEFAGLDVDGCDFRKKHVLKQKYCDGIICTECNKRTAEWLEQEYQEHITLTDDEKAILRSLDEKWKWLAKNKNGLLFLHEEKPYKYINGAMWENNGWRYKLEIFNHLFKFIKWEDEEPYNIDELLKQNGVERNEE